MSIGTLANWAVDHPALSLPLAVTACLAVLVAGRSVRRALADGRELVIGPIRIGPGTQPRPLAERPEREAHVAVAVATVVAPPAPGPADQLYQAWEAERFYSRIAPGYDARNTGPLLRTQLTTREYIQQARLGRPSLNVLDLGGGTGREIATHFVDDPGVSWTCVDFCPAMAAQFRSNLVDDPVRMAVRVVVADILRVHTSLPAGSYDVVLLSLVLTSMPCLPDLAPVARMLRPDGILIVSDIDPLYTERNPYYTVRTGDGDAVSLRTTPVQPHDVVIDAHAAGLAHRDTRVIRRDGASYAFVAVFTPAAG